MTWLPIELASKEADELLLWHPVMKRTVIGWWDEDEDRWAGQRSDFMAIELFENGVQPQWWQPMPEGIQEAAE